jgi:hypothetical protein
MSCAAFTFLGVYLTKFPQTPHWIYWANGSLAVFFLLLSGFLVWRDEHRYLQVELEKNSYPKFQIEVSRMFHDVTLIQGIPWLDCGNTYVAKLSLVNVKPATSSVQGVYVTLGDKEKRFPAKPFGSIRLGWQKEKFTRVFMGETITEYSTQEETISDLLPFVAEPMTRGSHKDGWVYLSDLPSADDARSFNFYVVDAYGMSHGPFLPKAEMEVANVTKPRTV